MTKESIISQIMALNDIPIRELQQKYQKIVGVSDLSTINRTFFMRKIAYRLQELESGGLSAKAQQKITELINRYDPINNKAFRPQNTLRPKNENDKRLPIPGTLITKLYKGEKLQVRVLEKGFEYEGKIYKTLTAVSEVITGCHWSGYDFFSL
jgi:hypothetical protein